MVSVRTLAFLCLAFTVASAVPFPSIFGKKKTYTPLYFFKIKGKEESRIMEESIDKIEAELGVRVERLNARDPKVKALLSTLNAREAPFLYHRESLQRVTSADFSDEAQIRAWAKGRYLPPRPGTSSSSKKMTFVPEEGEMGIDQDELLDASLTPEQKSGKDAIQQRTKEKESE